MRARFFIKKEKTKPRDQTTNFFFLRKKKKKRVKISGEVDKIKQKDAAATWKLLYDYIYWFAARCNINYGARSVLEIRTFDQEG